MSNYLYDLVPPGMTAGEGLLPEDLRAAGGLAERLGVDAVVILTVNSSVEENKSTRVFGKVSAQGDEYAVESVRLQLVNADARFVFAQCLRRAHPEKLHKGTFAFSYDPKQVLADLNQALDYALDKEMQNLSAR